MFRRRKPDAEVDSPAPEPEAPSAPEPAAETPPPPRFDRPLFAGFDDEDPEAARADVEERLEHGLERTRGGFMSRLRGYLGAEGEGPSWDDVEETLIAGDVGAALAMDVVEAARRRRDPGDAEAAVRAALASLLVPREAGWEPRPSVAGGPAVVLIV